MKNFLGNLLSGKNSAFQDRFTKHQQRICEAVGRLPAPTEPIQRQILLSYMIAIHMVLDFFEKLFYGLNDGEPALTMADLQRISPVQGQQLFCQILVCFIHCSVGATPELARYFVQIAHSTTEGVLFEALSRLSQILEMQDLEGRTQTSIRLLGDAFPAVLENPIVRMQVMLLSASLTATLNETIKKTLNEGMTN